MKNIRTLKICIGAMLAALVCIATMVFVIPTPMGGYIHIGDGFVLLSGWVLGPAYGFAAAAIGSALADIFSGYIAYAPVTFLIKGLMALIAAIVAKKLSDKSSRKDRNIIAHIASAVIAEFTMIFGYFIADVFYMGLAVAAAAAGIPWSCVQGLTGAVIGIALTAAIARTKLLSKVNPYIV